MTAVALLVLFLPFLLSLFGQGAVAKMLCLVTSILAVLLSVEPYGAVLPWVVGALSPEYRCENESGSGGRRDSSGFAPSAMTSPK
jgi:hypothetical protein